MEQPDQSVRITVRVPAEMHQAMKCLAERGDRSLHAQTLRILRRDREVQQQLEEQRGQNT